MQNKTLVLLVVLGISVFLFLYVLLTNLGRSDTNTIDKQSYKPSQGQETSSGAEVSLDKYFDFGVKNDFGNIEQKITPSITKGKKKKCLLDGQVVEEGTVNSNTICVD